MNAKKTVLPLIAAGGVAAALFGGASVQTAFTSTATGTLNASTARIGTVLANGVVTLANAVPGDTGPTSSVTITNAGSSPETLAVTFGTGSDPSLDSVIDVIWNGTDIGTLASLANTSFALQGNALQPEGSSGDSLTVPVALMLDTTATNAEASGADAVSFTITGTATSTSSCGAGSPSGGAGACQAGWSQVTNSDNFVNINPAS
jgi:hypothetical protein